MSSLSDEPGSPSAGPWLVFGLGNPGRSYAGNRHTVGHRVVGELAHRMGSPFRRHKTAQADVVEGRFALGGDRVVLARGRCYMNESGGPVSRLLAFYRIEPIRLVLVHDELDLPFNALRLKFGGGDNGHNGLRSVRRAIGTGDFHRVRLGVGRPPGPMSPADFVLSDYSASERRQLPAQVGRAADALQLLIGSGLKAAQSRYNH